MVAQLDEIARELRSAALQAAPRQSATALSGLSDDPLEAARRLYALRRRRGVIFGNAELFSEPAWDILLDLFIAHRENKSVSVSSACIGSAAPPTTGLRWLGILAKEGLVAREADPADHRRVMVRLTDRGLAGMERFFESVVGPPPRERAKP